jgi:transcriptional regulator with XRE-family HTH domain/tetratricopeptide (TPR) repeat protein
MNGEITFGKILRNKRTARGFTQRELANRAGVDASYISQLEGDRKSPSSKTLLSLADALDVEVAELLAIYSQEPEDESGPPVFVGREDIIEAFARTLDGRGDGLIVLTGPPGSGRTFLIRNRLTQKCREMDVAYTFIEGSRVPGYRELLLELRERFSRMHNSYSGFDEIYAQCSAIESKLRSRFNDPFGVPVSPRPGEGEYQSASPDELTYAEKYIYKDLERLLTGEFLTGFEQFLDDSNKTVIFVDDYDRMGSLTEYWFRELLTHLSETGRLGRDVVAVFSAERTPRVGAISENTKVTAYEIGNFIDAEVSEYAEAKGLPARESAGGELFALGGHPLSVALWSEYIGAESLYRTNKLGEAERVLEKLVSRMRPLERESNIRLGDLLSARVDKLLGHLARFEGRLARADGFYAASSELFSKMGPEFRRELGYVFLDRGNVCRHRGLWDDALKYYNEAGRVFAETNEALGGAIAHTSSGTVYRLKGDFASAKSEYETAQKTLTSMVNAKVETEDAGAWLACTLSNLSIMYRLEAEEFYADGNTEKAERNVERAEELCKEAIVLDADAAETAIAKNRLGLCYQARGEYRAAAGKLEEADGLYDRAEALHLEALSAFEDIGDKYRVAQIFGDLGAVAVLKGSAHDAIVHLKNSLALFMQLGSSYHIAKILVELGSLGRGEERLGYFSEALSAALRHNVESFEEIGKAVYDAMGEDRTKREKLFSDMGSDFYELYERISKTAAG